MGKELEEFLKQVSPDVLALNPDLLGTPPVDPQRKGNKYHAETTTIDGITFHSKKEARRYQQLLHLEQAGQIRDLRRQVPYILFEPFVNNQGKKMDGGTYIADFVYLKDGVTVIEDAKSPITRKEPYFRLKWRLLHHRYRTNYTVRIIET